MLEKLFNYKSYISYSKYFVILFLLWLSINTGSKYLQINYLEEFTLKNIFNLTRAILPYFLLIYYFFHEKKNKNSFFNNFDLVLVLFFLYGLLQLTGLIYYFENLYRHYWLVCLFSLIFFFNIIQKKMMKNF